MGFLTDILTDPIGVLSGDETVSERQNRQWQAASGCLKDAQMHMGSGDTDKAIAAALIGLLSLQMSKS